jgi:hypothetical protein
MQLSDSIKPRDSDGAFDKNTGKIGFLVLGFSTAAMTGRTFRSICQTQPVDPHLQIVIGAQGGMDINSMVVPGSVYWSNLDSILRAEALTASQIQIIWISTGDLEAASLPFPAHCEVQLEKYRMVLSNLSQLFPNLALVFISDMPFAGYIGA